MKLEILSQFNSFPGCSYVMRRSRSRVKTLVRFDQICPENWQIPWVSVSFQPCISNLALVEFSALESNLVLTHAFKLHTTAQRRLSNSTTAQRRAFEQRFHDAFLRIKITILLETVSNNSPFYIETQTCNSYLSHHSVPVL